MPAGGSTRQRSIYLTYRSVGLVVTDESFAAFQSSGYRKRDVRFSVILAEH